MYRSLLEQFEENTFQVMRTETQVVLDLMRNIKRKARCGSEGAANGFKASTAFSSPTSLHEEAVTHLPSLPYLHKRRSSHLFLNQNHQTKTVMTTCGYGHYRDYQRILLSRRPWLNGEYQVMEGKNRKRGNHWHSQAQMILHELRSGIIGLLGILSIAKVRRTARLGFLIFLQVLVSLNAHIPLFFQCTTTCIHGMEFFDAS